jgi:hypothetical protein
MCIMITPYEEIDKEVSLESVRPQPRRTRQVMNLADIMNQLQHTTGGETYPRQLSAGPSAPVPAGEVRTKEQAIGSACRLALRTQEALDGAFVGA